jgi:Na+/melibiose symporter-like transporter
MYLGKDWQPLIWMGTAMSLLSCLMAILIIESPRYLYSTGDMYKCNKALAQIAEFNHVRNYQPLSTEDQPASKSTLDKSELSIMEYIKVPTFRNNLIILTLLWVAVSFDFYLMGFYLTNMEGDINQNSLWQGVGMILAFIMSAPIIDRLGFKRSFAFFFVLSIIPAALYTMIPHKSATLISVLVFVGRLGICPCYSLTFIASNQLFPPAIKSSLFALCNIVARAVCMVAPIVALMKDPFPFQIFGFLALICCVAT